MRFIVEWIEQFPGSKTKAVKAINKGYRDGTLPGPIMTALEQCKHKASGKAKTSDMITLSTYNKWKKRGENQGDFIPQVREKDFTVLPWHVATVALLKRPQGSTLKWVHAELVKQFGEAAPSYHALRRWRQDKYSKKDQLKGRYTGSQLRSQLFYQHRTAEGLMPATLVHADGWNTHFNAPHPVTGEFVTYEVWHFHDVATRYVSEPGIGMTENAHVIMKGLENFVRELGVPARLQTDSTKVVKGSDKFTKALHSLEERLGFTWSHPSEVGNSQANGIAENFNTSWLDKRSRELATYQNKKSMDDLTFKRIKKLTAQMIKAANNNDAALQAQKKKEIERAGKGLVFGSFTEACAWIVQICREFNERPHSSLPKIFDPELKKKRHQTPREAVQEHIDNGWRPVALDEQELVDAFRPHVVVTVTRETVTPWGGMRYRNTMHLGHFNGEKVMVAYDIADYSKVWVKDLDGALICEAEFVEATRYHAQSAQMADEEKRAAAQLKRLENKGETIKARMPGNVIDGALEVLPAHEIPGMRESARIVEEKHSAEPVAAVPLRDQPRERYLFWRTLDERVKAGEELYGDLHDFHKAFPNTHDWRSWNAFYNGDLFKAAQP